MNNEMFIGTWNVLRLNRAGSLRNLKNEMKKYKIGVAALQLGDVENDMKKMCVRGWRKIARDRDAWKLILKEAKVLH
jgi:hypothetical protein